mmetsp:Transcript_58431/g.162893  ORF Transcript_58431/g.162893 Transcript_58431/m.162893 type:complete len:160 (-) Transcript_58431:175-654(-)
MSGSGTWTALREKFRTSERCTEASCHDRPSGGDVDGEEVEPPDRAEIGRAAWRYLHTAAAHHPEAASAEQEKATQEWIASFVQLYPCKHCAEHFVGVCESSPPETSTREGYAVWWCEAHNAVRRHLKNEPMRCESSLLLDSGRVGATLDELLARRAAAE